LKGYFPDLKNLFVFYLDICPGARGQKAVFQNMPDDWGPGPFFQGLVAPDMIKVVMGVEYIFDNQLICLGLVQDTSDLPARIDDQGFPGFFTAQQIAEHFHKPRGYLPDNHDDLKKIFNSPKPGI
jgi:hypothetical protein